MTSSAGTYRNSAASSMKRSISQGQATRSTRGRSRVIHFIGPYTDPRWSVPADRRAVTSSGEYLIDLLEAEVPSGQPRPVRPDLVDDGARAGAEPERLSEGAHRLRDRRPRLVAGCVLRDYGPVKTHGRDAVAGLGGHL